MGGVILVMNPLMEKRMQEWIETGADEEDKKPVPLNEVIDYVTEEREKKHPHIGRAEEAFTKFWAYKNAITYKEAKHQVRAYKQEKKASDMAI